MPNRFYMPLLNLENTNILVVEDDEMSFLYLNHLLQLTGSKVVRETCGAGAIEQFRNNPRFDIILMDIKLPDMDGTQVTREIRKLDKKVPIIAQTAGRTIFDKDLALEAGCSEVLTKPFSMEELFEMIGNCLGRR